jgi:hypothetical protein
MNIRVNSFNHRRGVKQFFWIQPGHWTPDNAANIVHAGLARDQLDTFRAAPDLRYIVDCEPSQLDLLARCDIGKSPAELASDHSEGA